MLVLGIGSLGRLLAQGPYPRFLLSVHGQAPWPGSLSRLLGHAPWPGSFARLLCQAFWPGSLAMLLGHAPWPCSLALLLGHAPWPCSLARLLGQAPWLLTQGSCIKPKLHAEDPEQRLMPKVQTSRPLILAQAQSVCFRPRFKHYSPV